MGKCDCIEATADEDGCTIPSVELYHTTIAEGALFYTSSHRRYPVLLTEELRDKVCHLIVKL